MKIKTNDLTGLALDWAVERCLLDAALCAEGPHPYSTDWAHGGPIIEREGISVYYIGRDINGEKWMTADPHDELNLFKGDPHPTPLIAAMRCFVASRLGDEVEVPDELMKE